ncbi:MAG: ACT domain-containing protein [Streptococcus orisratti]|uniref:ACT domain-containing protein n=1 Tax=Streptococcus orisratti TaxID=114652 RepID=UPI002353C314|nr:ACT domain-containing protein [Streptococcus orisratti]MCI7678068.1 ACT domain-containing protein [Streptococcus orisratti]
MAAIKDLNQLLASMEPVLKEEVFVFSTLTAASQLPFNLIEASIKEEEGLSVLVTEKVAHAYDLEAQFRSAWITLNVHSDLAAVGLTAAFASALGEVGLNCNVVAGNYHDHILVPYDKADLAMRTLKALQEVAQKESLEKHDN